MNGSRMNGQFCNSETTRVAVRVEETWQQVEAVFSSDGRVAALRKVRNNHLMQYMLGGESKKLEEKVVF